MAETRSHRPSVSRQTVLCDCARPDSSSKWCVQIMKLDESQKKTVTRWIEDGLKLSEIQKRLVTDLGVNLTYMEVRFLVDDLKLTPKDPTPPKVAPPATPTPLAAPADPATPTPIAPLAEEPPADGASGGHVSVTVDTVTRPGAMVSGSVTFSDGQSASWYMDQMGRLGVVAKTQGYKPSAADVQAFQQALETEFSKLGF